MVLGLLIIDALRDLAGARRREIACVSLLLLSASCVPLKAAPAPQEQLLAAAIVDLRVPPEGTPVAPSPATASDALAINASIPVVEGANLRAASVVFRSATPVDQLRSLQCLAEAVYYEARSESEDGQRAVAQVVLNRVRHPAYPSTVCGVVYQGPMRAGGGCQFTFTCDGSLALSPSGFGWARARRIAAEALAGSVYSPVGHATHYHTHAVFPHWAPRLVKSAVIGSHNFYRMPGAWGAPAAFSQRYAAREPSPVAVMASRLPVTLPQTASAVAAAPPPFPLPNLAYVAPAAEAPPPQLPIVDDRLPQSRVRDEYRNSGRLRVELDAPSPPPAG